MTTWADWEKPLADPHGRMPSGLAGATGIEVAAWCDLPLHQRDDGEVVGVDFRWVGHARVIATAGSTHRIRVQALDEVELWELEWSMDYFLELSGYVEGGAAGGSETGPETGPSPAGQMSLFGGVS